MLNHPTLDQLHALGLHGMAKAFAEIDSRRRRPTASPMHEWLGLLLDRESIHGDSDKRLAARLRVRQIAPAGLSSKTSITAPRAVSTAPCSTSSPRANGSTPTTI